MCNLTYDKLRFVLVLPAFLTVLAAAEPAAAQQGDFDVDLCSDACVLIGVAALSFVLVPPIVFGSAEIVYANQGRWFPLGWAVPELIYGFAMTMLTSVAGLSAEEDGLIAVPFVAVSGWFMLHAILSITLGQPKPPERASAGSVDLAITPLPGGGWLGIHGAL